MVSLKEILKLPVNERLRLVETIWDSILLESTSIRINARHKKIINERLKEYRNNPSDVIGWKEVRKDVRKLL